MIKYQGLHIPNKRHAILLPIGSKFMYKSGFYKILSVDPMGYVECENWWGHPRVFNGCTTVLAVETWG